MKGLDYMKKDKYSGQFLREKLQEYKEENGCTWKWIAAQTKIGYKTLTNLTNG